jgi:hypothetical protein
MSLCTERVNWIDASRAPSRNVGRDEDHYHQQRREGDGGSRADLELRRQNAKRLVRRLFATP